MSSRVITPEPCFPRERVRFKEFEDEFQKKVVVLVCERFDTKASEFIALTNSLPRKDALGAMARLLTGPKKRSSLPFQDFNNCFGHKNRRHVVDCQAAEDNFTKIRRPLVLKIRVFQPERYLSKVVIRGWKSLTRSL